MASLVAILYTALGGAATMTVTFGLFGCAIRKQSTNIAPRCTARSPKVVYNPEAKRPKTNGFTFWWRKKSKPLSIDVIVEGNNEDGSSDETHLAEHVQFRGGPMFGWIPWTLSLSYKTLLGGVPGTGTRKGGMEGAMLKVNLDGIVLLRFHDLALKVITLTTVLAIGIILPMNYAAQSQNEDITHYERTTIKNVPKLDREPLDDDASLFARILNILGAAYNKNLTHLYIVVFVSWIIVLYTMRLLRKEWIDALALRRVYYLESCHFENRRQELEETAEYMDSSSDEDSSDEEQLDLRTRRQLNKPNKTKGPTPKRKRKRRPALRQPWIPHPEQRETVPNIELYSVLVGNIPSKPSEVMEDDNIEAALGAGVEGNLHWQLEVATTFFDQCVPNQPGFSSSVAAVTILPDAPKLALAWRKWYRHVGLLRKLRFVRLLIAEMRHYDLDEMSNNDTNRTTASLAGKKHDEKSGITMAEDADSNSLNMHMVQNSAISDELWKRMNYKYDVFGTDYEEDVVSLLVQAMDYGPEQTAVYSREFAQGAAACCPNGCAEERTKDLRIDELLELEMEVKHMVEESFNELKDAQNRNVHLKNTPGHKGVIAEASMKLHDNPNDHELNAKGVTVEPKHITKKNGGVEVILNNEHHFLSTIPSVVHNSNSDKEPNFNDDIHAAETHEVENKNYECTKPSAGSTCVSNINQSNYIQSPNTMNNPTIEPHTVDPKKFLPINEPRPISDLNWDTPRMNGPHSLNLLIPEKLPARHTSTGSTSMDAYSLEAGQSLRSSVRMSNNGKVYTREVIPLYSNGTGYEENNVSNLYVIDTTGQTSHPNTPVRNNHRSSTTDSQVPQIFTSTPTCRRRLNTGNSYLSTGSGRNNHDQWAQVEEIISSDARALTTGVWQLPDVKKLPDQCVTSMKSWFGESIKELKTWASKTTRGVVEDISSDATFAVVTFTSRQAAVAARQCLADGRGVGKWEPVRDIPVPPLADAAVCDFKTCRGCCRPVSLTVNPKQQFARKVISWGILSVIYIFSSFAITAVAALVAPKRLEELLPFLEKASQIPAISGIIPALLFALFFAICPVIFKSISNFGSNAVSVNHAEETALQYYWWFMLITVFIGSSLGSMILNGLNVINKPDDSSLSLILIQSAASLATQTSATWLNWIIFRTFLTLPLQYMLQMNSYVFGWLGWRCCRRCVMGGGPGGPVPYRIYIDAGVVFLCAVALSPVAPLVAPAALLYFLYCAPLWRRNLIFMYRPKFDTGGLRWPFLADMYITSMLVAQILLTIVMALEQAGGPAILAALSTIPLLLHRRSTRQRYYKSYMDAALLQTSQLDTWDASVEETTEDRREQYRKFLVDAHKAAYVPICIAGGTAEALTAEPAVVVPHGNDSLMTDRIDELPHAHSQSYGTVERPPSPLTVVSAVTTPRYIERANQQLGASLRRLPATVPGGPIMTDESISSRCI